MWFDFIGGIERLNTFKNLPQGSRSRRSPNNTLCVINTRNIMFELFYDFPFFKSLRKECHKTTIIINKGAIKFYLILFSLMIAISDNKSYSAS